VKQQGMVHIVGVDLECGSKKIVIPEAAVTNCAAIIGTNRFLQVLTETVKIPDGCELVEISPLDTALAALSTHHENGRDTVILASGDPLFYGIGRKITNLLGTRYTRFYPALSSMQLAFSRLGIPWDDARLLSLHGRTERNYLGKILSSTKTALLTDGHHRAQVIAQEMCEFLGVDQYRFTLHVVENIGGEGERIFSGSPEEAAQHNFASLSVVIVVKNSGMDVSMCVPASRYPYGFGLTEQDIEHSRGLITKHEIRAAALHLLQVPSNSILWDVGAGSGSVGLEAARMHRDALVYAVEKNDEQHRNILANKKKFDLVNLKLVQGAAPSALNDLPAPDRVFIGGSGGNLSDIIRFCNEELPEQGVMIVTAVLEKTRQLAPQIMYDCGLQVELHTIAVTRQKYPETSETPLNPITIIVGRKQPIKE